MLCGTKNLHFFTIFKIGLFSAYFSLLSFFNPIYLIQLIANKIGRHMIDQKACWPNEKWWLTERFFLPKTVCFVWNNSYVGACLSVFTAWWPNANFYFRSIIKFHFGLTKKIFNLRLIAGIIDRKFPTFYVPIYPYKTYIFYCYETFCQELAGKSSPSCPRF